MREAAEYYGISVGKNGMAACPFHVDTNPSLKLNRDFYYCFGCGASGDVIDFVGQLQGLNKLDAAKMLAADFSIASGSGPIPKSQPSLSVRQKEEQSFRELLACRQKQRTALKTMLLAEPGNEPTEQVAEICRSLERIECMMDMLSMGNARDRQSVVSQMGVSGKKVDAAASKECACVQQ